MPAAGRFLIRDRDGKFSGLLDAVLKDAGIEVVLSGVQMPRMNAPPASTSADATVSAPSSTSTGMPLNLHG